MYVSYFSTQTASKCVLQEQWSFVECLQGTMHLIHMQASLFALNVNCTCSKYCSNKVKQRYLVTCSLSHGATFQLQWHVSNSHIIIFRSSRINCKFYSVTYNLLFTATSTLSPLPAASDTSAEKCPSSFPIPRYPFLSAGHA